MPADEYAEVGTALATTLNDPLLPPSASQQHTVERHRELLSEFQREFHRVRANVHQALERKRLLGTVKEDINAYRAAHASETQAYLAERGHIDNAHHMIDETLECVDADEPSVCHALRVPRPAEPAWRHFGAHGECSGALSRHEPPAYDD